MDLEEFCRAWKNWAHYSDLCDECSENGKYYRFVKGEIPYPCDGCTLQEKVLYWMERMVELLTPAIREVGKEELLRIIKRLREEY